MIPEPSYGRQPVIVRGLPGPLASTSCHDCGQPVHVPALSHALLAGRAVIVLCPACLAELCRPRAGDDR